MCAVCCAARSLGVVAELRGRALGCVVVCIVVGGGKGANEYELNFEFCVP